MGDWLEFAILSNGEVFYNGARYSKQEFARLFEQWLETATIGDYEVENLTSDVNHLRGA